MLCGLLIGDHGGSNIHDQVAHIFIVIRIIPFIALIGGFEYAYQKRTSEANETTAFFRKRFYKISTWLGLYFPIRFLTTIFMSFYPRPYNTLVLECIVLSIYMGVSMVFTLSIEEHYLLREKEKR